MPNVGYASLQIIPSVQGIGSSIRQQLTGPIADAGDEAGDGFAKRLAKGLAIGVAGAAAAVGAVLVKGLGDALEQGQLTGKLQAQLGATGPDAARYGKVAGQLFSGTMADSFEQGAEAIRSIMSAGLAPPGATNAQLKSISTQVLDVSKAFGVDLGETSNAVGQLIRNGMAKDATEGLNLVTAGLRGADARGADVLETFGEYSPVFKTMGLDGATAMGLLRQGLAGGARNTDNLGDAIKEFSLKVTGGGAAIDAAFKAAGLSSKKVTDDVAAGGPRASAALGTVLDALRQMPATAERAQVIQNLFGGPGEDLGAAIFSLNVKTAATSLGTLTGAADATGAALRDNAATHIEAFKRGLEQGITNMVGGHVLPALMDAASFLKTTFGPAFGQAAEWVKGTVLPATADLAHHVADVLVPALTTGASWLADHLAPAAADLAHWLRDDLLPAASNIASKLGTEFGPVAADIARILRDDIAPAVATVAGWMRDTFAPAAADAAIWLGEHLVPAVADLATWLTGTLVPALGSTAHWLDDNKTAIAAVAGIITTLLLPALITAAVGYASTGAAAAASKYEQVTAWVTTKVAAVESAAASVAASYRTVGGWISAGASAVAGAAVQVGAWISTGAAAVVSGAQQAATWVATGARAAVGAALQVGAAAAVVGGWVLMGVQSLLQAARMAAAWLIAMGPVGWVITAVVALVALIVANWETVKEKTVGLWTAAVEWIKSAAGSVLDWLRSNWPLLLAILTGPIGIAVGLIVKYWDQITEGFRSAYRAVVSVAVDLVQWASGLPGRILNAIASLGSSLYNSAKDAFQQFMIAQALIAGQAIEYVKGLPGKLVSAIGDLGSLLYSAGGDVVRGLWNGISSMGSWLKDKLVSFASSAIPGPIKSALGISSPSKVMASEVGRWIPAGIVQGIEGGQSELERTMAALVAVPPLAIPAWTYPAASDTSFGVSAARQFAPAAAVGATATQGPGQGPALTIENYYESESGGARQTAMDLMVLARGRG
jgi:phage-related protein